VGEVHCALHCGLLLVDVCDARLPHKTCVHTVKPTAPSLSRS